MGLLDAYRTTYLAQATLGEVVTPFNAANAYLAVGDGSAVYDSSHTDLQGASKLRMAMDATYPTRAGAAMMFRATFGPTDANHPWEEWGIANAAAGGTMMNRKVESNGTKASGATWQFEATVELL